MTASETAILTFGACFACACAQGYSASATPESASLAPPNAGLDGSFGGGAAEPSAGGMGGMGGTGAVSSAPGEPCLRNDVAPCPCEGTAVQGQRICVFDMASPTQGFFSSECQGCPAPAPEDASVPAPLCTDRMQNGAETGTDCGGPVCAACALPPTGGSGGAPPVDAGGDDPDPMEPVDDCDGVPEGTECDRDCILPFNTAHCNSRGNCSCL